MTDQAQRVVIEGPNQITVESLDIPSSSQLGDRGPGRVTIRASLDTVADRVEGRRRFEVAIDGWLMKASIEPARTAALRDRAARVAAQSRHHPPAVLRAQIPGRVVRVWVALGEAVEAGQRLLAVEAMKMENEVRAPRAGTIESIKATMGQTVDAGDELVTLG